jgi:hypothetical protein
MGVSLSIDAGREQVKDENRVANSTLVLALTDKQRRLGLADKQFAQVLGISGGLWSWTRIGQYPVGMALLRGTLRAFPDLWPEALYVLSGDLHLCNSLLQQGKSKGRTLTPAQVMVTER